jgi:hypothetical protein
VSKTLVSFAIRFLVDWSSHKFAIVSIRKEFNYYEDFAICYKLIMGAFPMLQQIMFGTPKTRLELTYTEMQYAAALVSFVTG